MHSTTSHYENPNVRSRHGWSAMAADLAKEHEVTAFDISEKGLSKLKKRDANIHTTVANLQQYSLYPTWFNHFDLLVAGCWLLVETANTGYKF